VLVEPTAQDVIVAAVVEAFQAFGFDIDRTFARQTVENDIGPTGTARAYGVDPEALWHYREVTASLAQQTHIREGGKRLYVDVATLEQPAMPLGIVTNKSTGSDRLPPRTLRAGLFQHGLRPAAAGAGGREPEPEYSE